MPRVWLCFHVKILFYSHSSNIGVITLHIYHCISEQTILKNNYIAHFTILKKQTSSAQIQLAFIVIAVTTLGSMFVIALIKLAELPH